MTHVATQGNRIVVAGKIGLPDYKRILATMHGLTAEKGYEDIHLDLQSCDAAFAGPVLALVATIAQLRADGIDVSVLPPSEEKLQRLFRNAGWLHALDPAQPAPPTFVGSPHVPTIHFDSPEEQFVAVNRLLDTILASLPGLTRHDLGALEWAVNEITDNVLVHADSKVGGWVHLSAFAARRQVEMVVTDGGLGIPATLRQGFPDLFSDSLALEKAVQEGITRSSAVGRGNGLFGTVEIARVSGGYMQIHSGWARLGYEDDTLQLADEKIPLHGTLVVACLDCSDPGALGNALKFGGQVHEPLDVVDPRYASPDRERIYFDLKRDSPSLGSRAAGAAFRTKVENMLGMRPDARLVLDFSGISVMSSSFADEVVGKLFQGLGPLRFMARVELRGLSETVRGLLDRAILQRSGHS